MSAERTVSHYRTDYAAAAGRPVQEGHAAACATHGHAAHTVDGIDQGVCPRCGDESVAAEPQHIPEPHSRRPGECRLCGLRIRSTFDDVTGERTSSTHDS